MVPKKLEQHSKQKHSQLKDIIKIYFERLRDNMLNQAKKSKSFTTIPDKARMVSYKIAQMLANKKKSHSDAESIILPVPTISADIMLGSEPTEKFKSIQLCHVESVTCLKTFKSSSKIFFMRPKKI